jgi:hypothetical protein
MQTEVRLGQGHFPFGNFHLPFSIQRRVSNGKWQMKIGK